MNASAGLPTLHVDIEGGLGGSSRSLFELLSLLGERIRPHVVHRSAGPIVNRYAEIGIPTTCIPTLMNFVPRSRNSPLILVQKWRGMLSLRRDVDRLVSLAKAHGARLIHLNYDGLFPFLKPLKRRLGLPLVLHSRTVLPDNAWGRHVASHVARYADHIVFISQNEQSRYRELADGALPSHQVVFNSARNAGPPLPRSARSGILYLGKIVKSKGVDRLLELGACLESAAAPPELTFEVYGNNHTRYGRKIQRHCQAMGLDRRIHFHGHHPEPEGLLRSGFCLVRLSHKGRPWGRDLIEAAAAGVPVLATGTDTTVVVPGLTGHLYETFDAQRIAEDILGLQRMPGRWQAMSEAAYAQWQAHFSGGTQGEQMGNLFDALGAGTRPGASFPEMEGDHA